MPKNQGQSILFQIFKYFQKIFEKKVGHINTN
jgi:hypothetical protein